jgi:hypothetical protein
MERSRNSVKRNFRKRESWGRMNEMKTGREVMIVKKGLERKLE